MSAELLGFLFLLAASISAIASLVACHIVHKQRKNAEIEKAIRESYNQDELPMFLKRQAD